MPAPTSDHRALHAVPPRLRGPAYTAAPTWVCTLAHEPPLVPHPGPLRPGCQPLALGTMTFGNAAWGSPDDDSAQILGAYLEAGGNVIDTADVYSGGRSEELVGRLIAERGLRDQVVLATKFGFNVRRGDPYAGGNGRKNIGAALEDSLRRLKTDHVDLYWLHVWDMVTPVGDVLRTLSDLVQAGHIRYFGVSDMPAWDASKMAALEQVHHVPGPIAMQLEYSLVAGDVETEHAPAARNGGMGIMPWSPLAGGFLAGKYDRYGEQVSGRGRPSGANPFQGPFTKFTERSWAILDALRTVAAQANRPPAQVALAWLVARFGVTSALQQTRAASRQPRLAGDYPDAPAARRAEHGQRTRRSFLLA